MLSDRVCAVRVIAPGFRLLLVNVYMPYEENDMSSIEYYDQLSVLESLINDNTDCHVIIGGDLKVDLSRARMHTALLDSFCDHMGLIPAVHHRNSRVDFTYHFNYERFSVIDRFLLSSDAFNFAVKSVLSVHDVDNTSDHSPLISELTLQLNWMGYGERQHRPSPAWAKASDTEKSHYRHALSARLQSVSHSADAFSSTDFHCSNQLHIKDINEYANSLIQLCVEAANETIPKTHSREGVCRSYSRMVGARMS